jgi:hypothetical protein
MEEQVDCAHGVSIGGQAFTIAGGFKMQDGGAGGKDAPIHCIDKGLFLREAEACSRRGEQTCLLGAGHGSQGKKTKNSCYGRAGLYLQRGTP